MIRFLLAFITRFLIVCLVLMALMVVIGRLILHPDIIAYTAVPNYYLRDVYVMDMSLSLSVNLTRDSADESNVRWSPDGNALAFNKQVGKGWDVYQMTMPTGQAVRLPRSTGNTDSLYLSGWSSEGMLVMGESFTLAGTYRIYIIDANGQNIKTVLNYSAQNTFPEWSPDKSRIAFSSNREKIYIITLKDGYIRPANCGDHVLALDWSSWSPDGSQIAFSAYVRNVAQIFVCNLSTGSTYQLTNFLTDSSISPSWSPDGEQIAFTVVFSGVPLGVNLYTIRPDGNDLRLLVEGGESSAWRP